MLSGSVSVKAAEEAAATTVKNIATLPLVLVGVVQH